MYLNQPKRFTVAFPAIPVHSLSTLDTFQGIFLLLSVSGGCPLQAARGVCLATAWIDSKGTVYRKWHNVRCMQRVSSVAQHLAEGH